MPGFSLPPAPPVLSVGLHSKRNAPLPPDGTLQSSNSTKPAVSVLDLAPLNFPRRTPRPVSFYALFKGWLLLSQPPSCLRSPTAFPTKPRLRDLNWRSGLFPSRLWSLSPKVRLPDLSLSKETSGGIRSWTGFGRLLTPYPHPWLYLRRLIVRRHTYMCFGENQLSPSSVGVSPLPPPRPTVLQHRWVRASVPG